MPRRADTRLIRGLHRRKVRESEGLFLAEGVRVAEELLASPVVPRLAIVSPTLEDTTRGAALSRKVAAACPVERVTDAELRGLAATEAPQGVLVVAETPHYDLPVLPSAAPAAVLALDAVQDPGNFGTLVRTAHAFGAAWVAMLPGTVDAWNPKAVRAAAGSSFRLPLVALELSGLRQWCSEQAFLLYGAAVVGFSVESCVLAQRSVLVVGNEGTGLSPGVERAADALLAVPLRGAAESLNVAVAAGILLYLLTRRD